MAEIWWSQGEVI
ncbi:unnamed protein product, partial [Rotaria sp. Silwood1]